MRPGDPSRGSRLSNRQMPSLEMHAAGIAQLTTVIIGLAALELAGVDLEGFALVGAAIALWVAAAVVSTAVYLAASSWWSDSEEVAG